MDRAAAIAILRSHEGELRKRGVRHAALFGPAARGDAKATSDLDVMIVLDRETVRHVYNYVGVVNFIEDVFPIAVDVAKRETLKEHVRQNAERDAVNAF